MLTLASVIAIAASYVWGFIDQTIGTKKACIISGCWYMCALLIMIFQNGSMSLVLLACVFVGFSVGGIGNLIPSMIGSCFGRFGFIEANRVIAPLQSIRYLGFVIISAVGVQNLVISYWIFLVFTAIGTVMMVLIRIPEYDPETGDPVGIYG
jgi:MFS family permease